MVDRKTIEVGMIRNIEGRPWKVPLRDEDGEVVWEDKETETPKLVPADTFSLLHAAIFSIPPRIHAKNDGMRSQQLFNAIQRAKDRGAVRATTQDDDSVQWTGRLVLHGEVYEWIQRVLAREVPITKAEKDMGLNARELASHLWGLSAYTILRQLTDVDSRKAEEDVDLEEPEELGAGRGPVEEEKPGTTPGFGVADG